MATISGNELVGETLKRIGVDTFFFIMGGPINDALTASMKRGMFAEITHPTRGTFHIPGWPVKMSDSRVPVKTAPLLGQHTAELLSEWLGMGQAEVEEYIRETPLKKGAPD